MMIKIKEIFRRLFKDKVSTTELAVYTRQLATLFISGLPFAGIFDVMREQTSNIKLKEATGHIKEAIFLRGLPLSRAMEYHKDIFSSVYIATIRCGENSGSLPVMLKRLTKNLENEVKMINRYKAALTYPVIAFVVSIITVIVALKYVLPNFMLFFASFNIKLSFPTRMLMHFVAVLNNYWSTPLILLIVFYLIVALKYYFKTPRGREFKDNLLMMIPVVNKIVIMIVVARFCRVFALLYESGYPLLPSLKLLKSVVNNVVFEKEIEKITTDITDGDTIAAALRKRFIFPSIVVSMISVGEESGNLSKTVFNVVYYYELEVENFLDRINALLEPVIIVILGIMITFILLAVIMPFYDVIGGLGTV